MAANHGRACGVSYSGKDAGMTSLPKIIAGNSDYFLVRDCRNPQFLDRCRVTGFTWTEQPHALVLAANRKYFEQASANPNVQGIVATPASVSKTQPQELPDKAVVVAEKAAELFYYLHNSAIHRLAPDRKGESAGAISASASIDPTAIIGTNVQIGEGVRIGPYCLVLDNSRIGSGSVLHPFVTVGTEGFFSKVIMGRKTHIRHFGGVTIGSNCILHSGTNVSRSVNFAECTVLGDDVHVGIYSNIGHDCRIGAGTDISAQVLLAGRVRVGERCWIGAKVVISNALTIGDGSILRIGSVVIEDVQAEEDVSGNFAFAHGANLKIHLQRKRR